MKSLAPRIVIELSGGEIDAIYSSNVDIRCTVLDWDELRTDAPIPEFIVRPLECASDDVKDVLKITHPPALPPAA